MPALTPPPSDDRQRQQEHAEQDEPNVRGADALGVIPQAADQGAAEQEEADACDHPAEARSLAVVVAHTD